MIEMEPQNKIHAFRLRALEENQRKADTLLEYKIGDECWDSVNRALKYDHGNPPDPENHSAAMREILDAKIIVFFGESSTGKSTAAIHAADTYAKAHGPHSVEILDLLKLDLGSTEKTQRQIEKCCTKGIVIIEWLDTVSRDSIQPGIFSSFLELLTYREFTPSCGPTIITTIQHPAEIAAKFINPYHGNAEVLGMKLDRAKHIQFLKQ